MENALHLFAKITPKEEHLSDAKSAILGIIQPTREETGCRHFELHEGLTEDCLYLYEEWDSQAALDEHYAQPYTKAVFESYQQWLAKPVEVIKMQKCSSD